MCQEKGLMPGYNFIIVFFALLLGSCNAQNTGVSKETAQQQKDSLMDLTNDDWKQRLSPEQYEVLRNKATERPFSGKFVNTTAQGTYVCAACGAELFSSKDKFDAGCGWPSFSDALAEGRIVEKPDLSGGMVRTEIQCARCGGHLGHLFDDGPKPTGLRYCVNSVSLDFKPAD